MHVLFATMQFGRGYSQGTERYIALLRAGLAELGVASTVLAGDPENRGAPAALGTPVSDDASVLHYPTSGWMATRGVETSDLEALLARLRPDVVHLVNPGFIGVGILAAAHRRGIPTVVTVVDYWWLCPKHTLRHFQREVCEGDVSWRECVACISADRTGSFRARVAHLPVLRDALLPPLFFGRWLMRGVSTAEIGRWMSRREFVLNELNQTDAVIFLSQTAQERIGARLTRPGMHLIRNGLSEEWFTNAPSRPLPSDPRNLVLGYAGALAPHKGLHNLLDALRILGWTQTRLFVAGGGDDQDYLARLQAAAKGLSVEWLGRLEAEAMRAFYRTLDALVVPSAWLENLPMVVFEARAANVPVLASRMPGVAEFVPDARLQFDPRDAADLARCLRDWHAAPSAIEWPRVARAAEMTAATLAAYQGLLLRAV